MEVYLPIFRWSCSNFYHMRFLLTIWISDCLCLTHIVEIWKHSLSVSFFGEAVQIWSLCVFSGSFGLQSWSNAHYFTINVYFRKKSYLPSMKLVVRTWACAISLCHLHFRLLMFGSHSQNQHAFTVSFISRRKFIFLFFNKAVRLLSLCEYSWSFGLQPWCTGNNFLSGRKL